MSMRDGRMPAAEFAGECRASSQVRRPVHGPHRRVKLIRALSIEPGNLEEDAICNARLQTRPISHPQVTYKGDAGGALFYILGTQRRQLASQQIRQPARRTRQ